MSCARIGHNAPSIADVVEDMKAAGIYRSHRDALVLCIRDPRLKSRHRVVLAELVLMTNTTTGLAYPGRRLLAERCGFTADTIATTVKELKAWGYVVSERRQPDGVGHPLMHYAVPRPSTEELEAAIAAHVQNIRSKHNVNSGVHVNTGVHVNSVVTADVNPVVTENVNPVIPTVTSKNRTVHRTGETAAANVQQVANWSTAFADPHGGEDVTIMADGEIVLSNGTRQRWLSEFDGDERALRLALTQAAGSVQPNSRQPLKLQIERVLARIAGERHDRDKRYASAARANARKGGKPSPSAASDEYERMARDYGITLPDGDAR